MDGNVCFRRVFEASADAELVLTPDALVVSASREYLRIVDLPRERAEGRSIYDLPPYAGTVEASRRLRLAFEGVLDSGTVLPNELLDAAPCASGVRFAWASSLPVTDEHGQVTAVLHRLDPPAAAEAGTETDRERRLRKLLEHTYDAVALFDRHNRAIFASDSIQRVLGYTEAEFIEKCFEMIHPEDVSSFGTQLDELFDRPGGLALMRFRCRHRDGSWRIVENASWNLLDDPDVRAVVSNFRDITEIVTQQRKLEGSHEQLRIALDAARAFSWECEVSARHSVFSGDYATFAGLPPGDYPNYEAVHPEDRAQVSLAMEHAIASCGEFQVQFRGPRLDLEPRYFAARGQVLCDEAGNPSRVLGVVWDVTAFRRIEEQQAALDRRLSESQKLESLGVLAGGVAHDFNNLLTAVLGNANLARLHLDDNAAVLAHLDQIEQASMQASELCSQMLAYAGKGHLELATVDLNALITQTTSLLQASMSKRVSLTCELAPELPAIAGDATQLRQVLMNLVLNGAEAITEGSGIVRVTTCARDADRTYLDRAFGASDLPAGRYVCLEVSDTGSGMLPEIQARIFEPFFSTKFPGRGLGLASVIGIVRGHGGAMKVESAPGDGTQFKLLLPAALDPVRDRSGKHDFAASHVGQGTILVVDDEERVRTLTAQMLELMGFDVLSASDGEEAVRVYRAQRARIVGVVMDLMMPRLDGEQALRALREIDPQVRALLMSGYDAPESIARLDGQRPVEFLHKPFSFQKLEAQVHAMLAGRTST